MKKVSLQSIITLILVIISMSMIMIGAQRQKIVLAVSGIALGFISIIAGSFVSSVININKRFPLRDDPMQKKIRTAKYLSLAASILITVGAIMAFVGGFMEPFGNQSLLRIAWVVLPLGFVMAIAGSVLSAVMSNRMSGLQEFSGAVPLSSTVVAQKPYSSDPVISRILANPSVLLDERIRQIPAVQNLLQYPEIQQIFFEPTKLYALFTQDRVVELMDIVRGRLTQNDGEEIFAAAEQRRSVNVPQAVYTDKTAWSSTGKKSLASYIVMFIAILLAAVYISKVITSIRGMHIV